MVKILSSSNKIYLFLDRERNDLEERDKAFFVLSG